MQSSWQRFARETLRCSAARRLTPATSLPTPRIAFPNICQNKRLTPPLSPFSAWQRTLATSASSFQQVSTSTAPRPPQESTPPTETEVEPPISPSQQALAAAKAIRLSVGSGNLPDAYLILNSVYYAKRDKTTLLHGIARILPQNAFKPTPIPFSPETPTRLVTHTLLHSLVKNGYRAEASRLMEELMKNQVVIAGPALNTVYNALTNPSINPSNGTVPTTYFSKVNILKSAVTEELVASQGGKHALRLLNIARESRRKRSLHLYYALIRLCIINGEIILASLVFGLLVRDWNACVVDQDTPLNADASGTAAQDNNTTKLVIKKTFAHERPSPFPKEATLDMILDTIEDPLKIQNPRARSYQADSVQALANLAVLLDHRLLATGPSPLIYLLARIDLKRVKREKQRVWVPIDDKMQEVDAQTYFNDVLTRLCKDPPSIAYSRSSLVAPITRNRGYMPALDVTGYKHLAYFALVKERSYELAKSVVDHMRVERRTPLKADALMIERFKQAAVATKDSRFLKAARFLASSDMANPLPLSDDRPAKPAPADIGRQVFLQAIKSDNVEQIKLHLDSFVKNKEWGVVHEFLHKLIPGYGWRDLFKDVDAHYGCWGTRVGAFKEKRAQKQFEEDVRKAVANGPKLVTSVLTALHRDGKYDAADRVWVWAKQMERHSWKLSKADYASDENLRPWTLPIAAYSVILQVRAAQIKMALNRPGEEGVMPVDVVRRSAVRIYEQAMRAGKLYGPLIEKAEGTGMGVHKDQELAIPDATFFNAILDILRHNSVAVRPTVPPAQTVSQAVEEMEDAVKCYAGTSGALHGIDKPLLQVGRGMLRYGHPIPLGLRHLFVGHGVDVTGNDVDIELWDQPAYKLSRAWNKKAIL